MYCNAHIFTDNKILTDQGILPTTSDKIFSLCLCTVTLTYRVCSLTSGASVAGSPLLELDADPLIQLDAVPFPCGSGPESILHPHGLELLWEVLVQTHLREVLPNYLLWHSSRSWSPSFSSFFFSEKITISMTVTVLNVVSFHTWLIKIIPLLYSYCPPIR